MVTGLNGQVVSALGARAVDWGVDLTPVGRPQLDLEDPSSAERCVREIRPDAVVSAAAYTAVDAAEGDADRAFRVNAEGPAALAAAAAGLGAPIVHLSTDYVFDGRKDGAYVESDAPAPVTVYGASKLAGEAAVAAANPAHVILRTAWVYGPTGKNFVDTMLRLGGTRDEVRVVADQRGSPTYALDIADGVLKILQGLHRADSGAYGVFHMTGAGEATWADFAEAVFQGAARRGAPSARVVRISSSEFPTAAKRPLNSRLNCDRIRAVHGVELPSWRTSLEDCLDRMLQPGARETR